MRDVFVAPDAGGSIQASNAEKASPRRSNCILCERPMPHRIRAHALWCSAHCRKSASKARRDREVRMAEPKGERRR